MKVFLSAVSGQFKSCRDALASDLRAIGCEVKVQEDFQQGGGSLIAQIESYVAQCNRVIAIVGDAYGADASSDAIPPGKPQRSYTQWVYFFAIGERLRGSSATAKDVYVYFASESYLDQHRVIHSENEKHRQQSFVEFIKKSGKHRGNFDNLDQLCRRVLRDGWQLFGRPNIPRPPLQLPNRALAGKLFGRAALLKQLVERLKNRENIDIWGPAGMGKTALAAEAIAQVLGNASDSLTNSPFPDGVVVLDLYRLKFVSPDPAWHHLANSFDATVPTTQSARERAIQACQGRRALVIVEGAEEAVDGSRLKELLSVLPQQTVRLVLTRNKAQVSTAKPFNVEAELEQNDALALLRELWQDGRDEAVVDLIYQRFGGHPLALTWAGSQLNAAEESPKAFVQALNAATLPALSEPGYEKHTLTWLFQRSVSHLTPEARIVLAAAGLLAQQAFPLTVAESVLPDSSELQAREALKQLVRYGLLRVNVATDERWEFTHALTHQFAHATPDLSLLLPLGSWAIMQFEQGVDAAKTGGDFAPLGQALAHSAALLGADRHADILEPLAQTLRYRGDVTLTALGRLDLVRAANAADRAWLLSANAEKSTTVSWQRELSVSYNKLGDVAVAGGDLVAARQAYEQSLLIRERLAESDPSNSGWQRDLVVSHAKMGDLLVKLNRYDDARATFKKAEGISERLTTLDSSNAIWRNDMALIKARIEKLIS